MAVPDGTILRVVASLLFPESVIAQNIFYAVFADTGGSDDDDDVISDLADWIEAIYDELAAEIQLDVQLTDIKVYFYDAGDDDWDELGADVLSDSFTGADEMLPHGVAAIQHAKTTNPDVQASKYWGGLDEGAQNKSILSANTITALTAAGLEWVTAFVGAATGADFGPGVWSPTKVNFFLFNGVYVTNGYMGYQRRRKPGVGI